MPEAGDHAARIQEGAKRQESRRLEVPGQGADRAFGQVGKKRRQPIITRRMVIFRFVPTTGPTAFMIKRAGKFDKKVMSKKAFSDSPRETCVSSSRINEKI